MGAHVQKRHVTTKRGVGGSRVDVLVVPGRCDVRSRRRSVSVSSSWTISRGTIMARSVARGRGFCAGRPFRVCFLVLLYPSMRGYPGHPGASIGTA